MSCENLSIKAKLLSISKPSNWLVLNEILEQIYPII